MVLRGPKSHLGGHKVTNYWQTKTNEAWAVLENLSFGEQYEVRVCFPASTPALLRLEIWEPSEAFAGDAAASLAGFEIGDEPNVEANLYQA
ncbi:hypothetical protein L0F63_005671 [Massospora cicadina]|nr:hypothetical protein L0F63_005671 [Massospora cicadina]